VLIWLSFVNLVGVLIKDWCQIFLYKDLTNEVVTIYLFIFIADKKIVKRFIVNTVKKKKSILLLFTVVKRMPNQNNGVKASFFYKIN